MGLLGVIGGLRVLHCVRAALTKEVGEEVGLVVVHRGHTHGVEAHQAEHGPVEGLRLDDLADEEAQATLPLVEGRGVAPLAILEAAAGKRRTWGGGGREEEKEEVERGRGRSREEWEMVGQKGHI